MTTENPAVREIEELRRLTAQYAREEEERRNTLASRVEKLRELIASQEWTLGDSVTEYFLKEYGIIDEEIARPLHELEEKMVGMKGQLFLVVRKTRERHRYGGDSRADDYHLKVIHYMGILEGEEFVFCADHKGFLNESECLYGIPTEKYLQVGMGAICENGPFLFPLMRGIHTPHMIEVGAQVGTEFEVVVGDTDVLGYRLRGGSTNQIWAGMLKNAARALGKELPE